MQYINKVWKMRYISIGIQKLEKLIAIYKLLRWKYVLSKLLSLWKYLALVVVTHKNYIVKAILLYTFFKIISM